MSLISHIYKIPSKRKKKHKKLPDIPLATPIENTQLLDSYYQALGTLPFQSILKEQNYLTMSDEDWNQFLFLIHEVDRVRQLNKINT